MHWEYFSRGLIAQFYEYVIRFVSIKFDVKVLDSLYLMSAVIILLFILHKHIHDFHIKSIFFNK